MMKTLLSIWVFALSTVLAPSLSWAGEKNLLDNGSAETGDLAGWQTIKGRFTSIDKPSDKTYPGPVHGRRYFFGGKHPVSAMYQNILLPEYTEEMAATFSGNLHGYNNDYIEAELAVFDAAGRVMSEGTTGRIIERRWNRCKLSVVVPAGASSVKLKITATRVDGKDNDGYADNLALSILSLKDHSKKAEVHLGPALIAPTADSVYVWWALASEHPEHYVEVSSKGEQDSQVHLKYWTKTPVIKLENLSPGRTYTYRVCSGMFKSRPFSFRLKDSDESVRVGIWADNQYGITVFQKQTLAALSKLKPDVLISVGDVVQNGDRLSEWENQLYKPAAELLKNTPWFPVRGNHDGESELARQMMPLPGGKGYYSANLGFARLVVLDSNISHSKESPQYLWVEEEVRSMAWRKALYRIVCFHEPPFTNLWDSNKYKGTSGIRNSVVPLLEEHKTDLVLNGHTHGYERGDRVRPDGKKTHYLTVGGGGGKLDKVRSGNWTHIKKTRSIHHVGSMTIDKNNLTIHIIDTGSGEKADTLIIKPDE